MSPDDLIDFEEQVKDAFISKRIHTPVHLSGGNERQLVSIFERVKPNDWVFSAWRSHYHALLKGVPPKWVYKEILAGRSMYLMNKEHRLFCSAIVGGILPIACGVALAIKRRNQTNKVWVFVGDMTARTGIFHEFLSYCDGQHLPVMVVIEDNGLSTNSPTEKVWGGESTHQSTNVKIISYKYERTFPHVGVGEHVQF